MLHSNQVAIEQIGHELEASVLVPGSKSISNRVLLLGALAEGTSKFSNIQTSDDSWVFVQALRELGFSIQQPDANVYVINGQRLIVDIGVGSAWLGSLVVISLASVCVVRQRRNRRSFPAGCRRSWLWHISI